MELMNRNLRRGRVLKILLIVFLVMVLVCGGLVGVALLNARSLFAWMVSQPLDSAVQRCALPADQKIRIKASLDQLLADFKSGRVSYAQLSMIFQKLVDEPFFNYVLVEIVRTEAGKCAQFDEQRRQAIWVNLDRLERGMAEKRIAAAGIATVLDTVSRVQPGGVRQLKQQLTSADIEAFSAAAGTQADQAGIPNEPYQLDLASEIQRIIDSVLGTVTTSAPAPTPPPPQPLAPVESVPPPAVAPPPVTPAPPAPPREPIPVPVLPPPLPAPVPTPAPAPPPPVIAPAPPRPAPVPTRPPPQPVPPVKPEPPTGPVPPPKPSRPVQPPKQLRPPPLPTKPVASPPAPVATRPISLPETRPAVARPAPVLIPAPPTRPAPVPRPTRPREPDRPVTQPVMLPLSPPSSAPSPVASEPVEPVAPTPPSESAPVASAPATRARTLPPASLPAIRRPPMRRPPGLATRPNLLFPATRPAR